MFQKLAPKFFFGEFMAQNVPLENGSGTKYTKVNPLENGSGTKYTRPARRYVAPGTTDVHLLYIIIMYLFPQREGVCAHQFWLNK